MVKSPSFEVIAGSYEQFLLGYNYSSKECKLIQSFAAHDHTASIRSVTICGHYVASGGADDRIFVYDMKTRKEHCSLTHHSATISSLEFTPNHSHLISASSDGVLSIVRVGNWQLEKIWEKAHKGAAILDIAVHSSGKLALSLGSDYTLCTWNLVKGRQAYKINLGNKSQSAKDLEKILWAPDGVKFVLFGGKFAELWSIESGGSLDFIEFNDRVTCCVFKDDSTLIIGLENGEICVYNLEEKTRESIKAHTNRVKAVALHRKWIVSASSSGDIKVWSKDFEELSKIETGCRLTCLCIVPPIKVKDEKPEEAAEIVEVVPEKPKKVQRSQVRVILNSEDECEDDTGLPKKKKKKKDKKVRLVE